MQYCSGTMKYCDGTTWTSLPSNDVGAACSSAGEVSYSSNKLRFCSATALKYPYCESNPAGAGVCSTAGEIQFDSDKNRLEFCDNTKWIQMLDCGIGVSETPIYCWGAFANGQLGAGSGITADAEIPTIVETLDFNTWSQVTVGNHGVAINRRGQIYAWGNDSGELGNGSVAGANTAPQERVPLPAGVTSWIKTATVSENNNTSCAIANTGNLYCWGAGLNGQIGDGLAVGTQLPTNPVTKPSGVTSWQSVTIGSGGGIESSHVCAIANTGDAYCWGDDKASGVLGNGPSLTADQTTPSLVIKPSGVSSWTAITASLGATCAIADTGEAYCWGSDSLGLLGNGPGTTPTDQPSTPVIKPSGVTSWTQIDVGQSGCAIADTGDAYCWGNVSNGAGGTNPDGPNVAVTKPSGVSFWLHIETNRTTPTSVCALANTGNMYCWGTGSGGAIGNGTTSNYTTPELVTKPSGVASWLQFSFGSQTVCAIANNYRIFCWGPDSQGQLGDGPDQTSTVSTPTAIQMNRIDSWSKVCTGITHSCGIDSNGIAYCWGNDGSGRLGNGSIGGSSTVPSRVVTPSGVTSWSEVSCGNQHTCGIANTGDAYCWGRDTEEQLGDGTGAASQQTPVLVTKPSGVSSWTHIQAGILYSCGIGDNDQAYCWGTESSGELGSGGGITDTVSTPTLVTNPSGVTSWKSISAYTFTCGIANTDAAYCWGNDSSARLGNGSGTTTAQSTPSLVEGVFSWKSISVSRGNGLHACGLTTANAAYCWGSDISGRLGNGSVLTANQASPSAVTLPSGVTSWQAIDAGGEASCAKANTGSLYCWGADTNGRLGNGASVSGAQSDPTLVTVPASASGWTNEIAGGGSSACAIGN